MAKKKKHEIAPDKNVSKSEEQSVDNEVEEMETKDTSDKEEITLVDNYDDSFKDYTPIISDEPDNTSNSKKFKKPKMKLKKPFQMKKRPSVVLSSATDNIRKTADSIRIVADSVDGIVNSLELLVPVVSSLSKEYVRALKNKNNYGRKSEDNRFTRNVQPTEKPETPPEPKVKAPSNPPPEVAELLQNPLVQNILKSLGKKSSD